MDLDILRHSTSHVLAQAVKALWPKAKLGIGPSIENGFYYDFDKDTPFEPEDLGKIEAKMREIIKKNYKFEKEEMKKELTDKENKYFFYAGKFMIYMQALRFLTDHINDDVYYGAKYEGQNFVRASNQMILLERYLEKEKDLGTYGEV